MTRDELLNKFWDEARYNPQSPKGKYQVRVGAKMLFDNDTQELFNKYLKAIKKSKSQV